MRKCCTNNTDISKSVPDAEASIIISFSKRFGPHFQKPLGVSHSSTTSLENRKYTGKQSRWSPYLPSWELFKSLPRHWQIMDPRVSLSNGAIPWLNEPLERSTKRTQSSISMSLTSSFRSLPTKRWVLRMEKNGILVIRRLSHSEPIFSTTLHNLRFSGVAKEPRVAFISNVLPTPRCVPHVLWLT